MPANLIVEISIPSTKTVRAHIEYQFILISNIPEMPSTYVRTYRRYSQVRKLHKRISSVVPGLPEFPGKVWLWNRSQKVVESRRRMFEMYFAYVFEFIVRNNLREEKFAREVFGFFVMN